MRYVEYKVAPFITASIPSAKKRDTHITVEQLKIIRDMVPDKYNVSVVRDIFMLTYYLAGMNLVDMLAYDFGQIWWTTSESRQEIPKMVTG